MSRRPSRVFDAVDVSWGSGFAIGRADFYLRAAKIWFHFLHIVLHFFKLPRRRRAGAIHLAEGGRKEPEDGN
jgi:hypothetical protein